MILLYYLRFLDVFEHECSWDRVVPSQGCVFTKIILPGPGFFFYPYLFLLECSSSCVPITSRLLKPFAQPSSSTVHSYFCFEMMRR
ncbi:hypothetical protein NC653_000903 [Populus alba x Populus x berolinensis]|uniref:Uncharacterized protein n=1 Tax=Populus alba x Populus x berolinensis TaxID=444605 RepID=A0AAD6RKS5_9ROSI|nr:hypothetical protein NC653_000903 [Populus alba x Populus x berolinensis]